jgi:hypothetical protein
MDLLGAKEFALPSLALTDFKVTRAELTLYLRLNPGRTCTDDESILFLAGSTGNDDVLRNWHVVSLWLKLWRLLKCPTPISPALLMRRYPDGARCNDGRR